MSVQLRVAVSPILPEVLELLICPATDCRHKLALEGGALKCGGCGRRYRIEGTWPVLIPEEAEQPTRSAESPPETR